MTIESLTVWNNFELNQNTEPTDIKEQGSDGIHSIAKANRENFLNANHSPRLHQPGDSSFVKWTIATLLFTLIHITDTKNITENPTMSSTSTLKNNASDVLTNTTESTSISLSDVEDFDIKGLLIATGLLVFAGICLFGALALYSRKHPVTIKQAPATANTDTQTQTTTDGKTYDSVPAETDGENKAQVTVHRETGSQEQGPEMIDTYSQPGTSKSFSDTAV